MLEPGGTFSVGVSDTLWPLLDYANVGDGRYFKTAVSDNWLNALKEAFNDPAVALDAWSVLCDNMLWAAPSGNKGKVLEGAVQFALRQIGLGELVLALCTGAVD